MKIFNILFIMVMLSSPLNDSFTLFAELGMIPQVYW